MVDFFYVFHEETLRKFQNHNPDGRRDRDRPTNLFNTLRYKRYFRHENTNDSSVSYTNSKRYKIQLHCIRKEKKCLKNNSYT